MLAIGVFVLRAFATDKLIHKRQYLLLVAATLAVLSPTIAYRAILITSNGLPDVLSTQNIESFVRGGALFTDISWVSPVLFFAGVLGVVFLIASHRCGGWFIPALLFICVCYTALTTSGPELDRLRLQSPILLLLTISAGAPAAHSLLHANAYIRTLYISFIVFAGLAHVIGARQNITQSLMPQDEFKFLVESSQSLNPECAVISPARVMAKGKIYSDFPTWEYPQDVVPAGSWELGIYNDVYPCAYYYLSLPCNLYSWQESKAAHDTPFAVRPECQSSLGQPPYAFSLKSSIHSKMDVSYLSPTTESVEVGFVCIYGICHEDST